jgi:DNA-binding response OmpR family regulator
MLLNNVKYISSSGFSLSLVDNLIYYNDGDCVARLSKYEVKLFHCLFQNRGCKEYIIFSIWGCVNDLNIESKYNQLICRIRKKLMKAGFPREIIVTEPRSGLTTGVFLNESCTPFFDKTLPERDVEAKVINVFQM